MKEIISQIVPGFSINFEKKCKTVLIFLTEKNLSVSFFPDF